MVSKLYIQVSQRLWTLTSVVRYFKISKASAMLNLFKKIVNKTFYYNSFYLCMVIITNIFFTIHPNTVYMIWCLVTLDWATSLLMTSLNVKLHVWQLSQQKQETLCEITVEEAQNRVTTWCVTPSLSCYSDCSLWPSCTDWGFKVYETLPSVNFKQLSHIACQVAFALPYLRRKTTFI